MLPRTKWLLLGFSLVIVLVTVFNGTNYVPNVDMSRRMPGDGLRGSGAAGTGADAGDSGEEAGREVEPAILKRLTDYQRELIECSGLLDRRWEEINCTLGLESFDYLPNYKNPCWLNELSPVINGSRQIRCLPYFYVAGFQKCGSTDFFHSLLAMPNITMPPVKAPRWWSNARVGAYKKTSFRSFAGSYLSLFDGVAERITAAVSPDDYHPVITGDGSVSTAWDNDRWPLYPGNEGLTEPKYTTADHIQRITPNARIIFLMRDPVTRVYSNYLMEKRAARQEASPKEFHTLAMESVVLLRRCIQRWNVRRCAYDACLHHDTYGKTMHIRIGMYAVFLQDWLKVFPREQILAIKFEHYAQSRSDVMRDVMTFLGIGSITDTLIHDLDNRFVSNRKRAVSDAVGPMRNDTRELLQEFFTPFNQKLARVLRDTTTWWDYEQSEY